MDEKINLYAFLYIFRNFLKFYVGFYLADGFQLRLKGMYLLLDPADDYLPSLIMYGQLKRCPRVEMISAKTSFSIDKTIISNNETLIWGSSKQDSFLWSFIGWGQ